MLKVSGERHFSKMVSITFMLILTFGLFLQWSTFPLKGRFKPKIYNAVLQYI